MAMTKVSDRLRNAELDTLTDAIVRKYEAAAAAEGNAVAGDAFLKATCATIRELSAAYTTAIKQSPELSTKDDADAARDAKIRMLFALAEGYALIPIPAKQAAGQAVKAVLDKYGEKPCDRELRLGIGAHREPFGRRGSAFGADGGA